MKKQTHLAAGMAAGTILGLAAGLFLQSKQGKRLTKDAEKKALQLQKKVMRKLEGMEDLTKDKYDEIVDQMVEHYVKGKDILEKEVPAVRKYLMSRWKSVESQLKSLGQEEE